MRLLPLPLRDYITEKYHFIIEERGRRAGNGNSSLSIFSENKAKGLKQTISRILFPMGIAPHRVVIIHLGHPLLNGSSDLPGRLWRTTIFSFEIEG